MASALLLALTACGGDTPHDGSDTGADAGADASPAADAGAERDAGSPADAGERRDAGPFEPETRIASAPPEFSAVRSAAFTFTSNDGSATFECALDEAAFTPCVSPASYEALGEGPHRFAVRAVSAGLADATPATRAWTVDTTAPVSRLSDAPSSEGASQPAAFVFDAGEEGCSFECALDGAPFAPCTSPALHLDLVAGPHRFEVRATDRAGNLEPSAAHHAWTVSAAAPITIRVLAANTTSGNQQSYSPGHGIRIFQGLDPDVVLLQEFKYEGNSAQELRAFVDEAFGARYAYARETGVQLPNGIVSRFPILEAGVWDDPEVNNRGFAWARIDVPGPKDLWAVSLHLLTANPTVRNAEATSLVGYLTAHVPEGDYLVLGGDLNTNTRTEPALQTLARVVPTSNASRWPVDHRGNGNTNANRDKPYDWLLPDAELSALETPLIIGASTYPAGLVFDSRIYTPLSEVAPVLQSDSAAPNMQHMAVGKDFRFAP